MTPGEIGFKNTDIELKPIPRLTKLLNLAVVGEQLIVQWVYCTAGNIKAQASYI